MPREISHLVFEVPIFLDHFVLRRLHDFEGCLESFVFSDSSFEVNIALPQLDLQLANCLLAVLHLVFELHSPRGELPNLLL